MPIYFDLYDSEQIKSGIKSIMASKQKIDTLVNIAGLTYNALFHMTTMEKMKHVFEIDFFSQMLVTQYVTKIMARQKFGNVINVSSIAGIDGNPGQIAYSSCKAALIGATKTLAAELAEFNIRVNAIAPGVVKTDMTSDLPPDVLDRLMKKSDLNRIGMPSEIANVLLFLASDMSSYITGQILRIDGGIGK
jgi:3-oxoacyl-[acyl-carrier protein] reductase